MLRMPFQCCVCRCFNRVERRQLLLSFGAIRRRSLCQGDGRGSDSRYVDSMYDYGFRHAVQGDANGKHFVLSSFLCCHGSFQWQLDISARPPADTAYTRSEAWPEEVDGRLSQPLVTRTETVRLQPSIWPGARRMTLRGQDPATGARSLTPRLDSAISGGRRWARGQSAATPTASLETR